MGAFLSVCFEFGPALPGALLHELKEPRSKPRARIPMIRFLMYALLNAGLRTSRVGSRLPVVHRFIIRLPPERLTQHSGCFGADLSQALWLRAACHDPQVNGAALPPEAVTGMGEVRTGLGLAPHKNAKDHRKRRPFCQVWWQATVQY